MMCFNIPDSPPTVSSQWMSGLSLSWLSRWGKLPAPPLLGYWCISLLYYVLQSDYYHLIIGQMAVWLVLLEQSSVPGGMSSHLYHSSMSLDHPEQSICPSLHHGQSYGGFIVFQRLYQQKWTREITEKIDLASWVIEMAWNFDIWCISTSRRVLQQFTVNRCPDYLLWLSQWGKPPKGRPLLLAIDVSHD